MTESPDFSRLRALRPAMEMRHALLGAVRAFFRERGFLEVETPILLATPALELHIDAVPAGPGYLRTSPEFHMKRLLAAGADRLFQVGPCFRAGERGDRHHPEFSMLEWYRTGADYLDLMADAKALVQHLARTLRGATDLMYQGRPLAVWPDWECLTVSEAFLLHAGWDPVRQFDADRFDRDLVDRVEPALTRERPVFLYDYPAPAAALARHKPAQPEIAERWELYLAGLEIANAYSELTDPEEQLARFEGWAEQRRRLGREVYPIDQEFLAMLRAGLPPCGGAALGLDRLLMIFSDAASLDD
jgi:lysyl-tRNA synthetase class 2